MPPNDADIIIAGAGLSGLSLASKLSARGYAGRVLILDQRADFLRDQRWCTWGPVGQSVAPLATHSWTRWQVIGESASSRFHLPGRPYTEFQASRYLGAIADNIAQSPSFQLHLNTGVQSIDNKLRWAEVTTDQGTLQAKWVIDSRGDNALAPESPRDVWLWQSFVGYTITANTAAFEPGCVTLMDFRTTGKDAAEFFYVLPYSPTRALVECTVVDRAIWPLERYRAHLEAYLSRLGLRQGDWTCDSEEIGAIPMTTHKFPTRSEGAVVKLGIAAGAAKPSTGYGFSRALRQADAVADALCSGMPPHLPQPGARASIMDTILIDVVAAHPDQFRRGMLRLFERVDAAAIVRFLSEESTLLDDMRVASVVGSVKFAEAAAARYAGLKR